MPNFAHITLVGHLGQDTDMKYLQSGTAVANNSIAVKTGYGDKQDTSWYRLTVWGKTAELFNEWTKKGMAVLVSGEPSIRKWTDNNGVEHQSFEVNVRDFQTLERRDNGNHTGNSEANPATGTHQPPVNSDIPFDMSWA